MSKNLRAKRYIGIRFGVIEAQRGEDHIACTRTSVASSLPPSPRR
jgi:hypothetical protein